MEILQTKRESHLKIKYKQYIISTSIPDNVVLLNDKTILKIITIYGSIENILVAGNIWEKEKCIFNYPFSSSELDMYELRQNTSNVTNVYPLHCI